MRCFFILLATFACFFSRSQPISYPYPVSYLQLNIGQQAVKMAYMDAGAEKPNGETILLFHGKNFNGYYWKDLIPILLKSGYRVVVPDQVGWGLSDKPSMHYSFHLLAANTKNLLDTLGISKVHLIGHSMGGMLAARFALSYPAMVGRLILENPIGLEDYRTFVPYRSADEQFTAELKTDYELLKKYQQSYYPEWKPEYEQYVRAQHTALQIPDFRQASWAAALSYLMIYEQPVLYEFKLITQPALIVIGQEDRTVVGKNLLTKETAAKHGQYPALGKQLQQQIKGSKLVELKGVGHIPHIQSLPVFAKEVVDFLSRDKQQ
ncbi:MAG TPA: alpha/beta hydrolase [Flavisolibacter sp.]|nr:alpha/beta hydrolase [Flavisolibacter sp.]